MSLFAVQRYLGEEDEVKEKQEASDILKQLQEEAKARKRALQKDVKNEASPAPKKDSSKELVEETGSHEEEKWHKKHQKHKAESSSKDTEISQDVKVVENDKFETVKKKKKKRKRKLSETNLDSESLIEGECVSPVKKIKEELQIEDTEGSVEKEKHKKHKKRKHRQSDDVKVEGDNSKKEDSDTNGNFNSSLIEKEQIALSDADMQSDDDLEHREDKSTGDKDGDEKLTFVGKGKETEIGGFTVIGNVRPAKPEKVQRVLPDWLSKPSIISSDLNSDKLPVTEMTGLERCLVDKLKKNGITHFFPVQRQVIPALLETSLTGFHSGRAGYRPSDLCVSAPTGSGKTLAFVLPVIQALKSRVRCEVRALAVLPVRDLATQVFKVFQAYCEGTRLKVGLMIGQKTLLAEQQSLVKKRLRGYESLVDIIVATPGRLVDHVNQTDGFNLGHLRYLVVDEADRMMDEIKQDWLIQVETAIYRSRPRPGPLTASSCRNMEIPLQKLLYSATLSQNPEKLQQLNLFQPRLFTSVVKAGKKSTPSGTGQNKTNIIKPEKHLNHDSGIDNEAEDDEIKTSDIEIKTDPDQIDEKSGEFVGKYATPSSLSEYYIETESGEKPLVILHLLHHLKYRNILCFTNSVESTHRLFLLIKLYGGIEVKEFSSSLHVARRNAILKKFAAGKIDILVCSDAMARGMDITTVKYVVSYDPPSFIQTYIHRIGRTARAGKDGTAFTLLQKKEFFHFKKMMRQAGKGSLKSLKIFKDDLKPLLPKYEEALKQLGDILKDEKPKRKYTPKKLQKPEIKDNTG